MASVSARTRSLERVVKGFSNHRRIEILALLQKQPALSLQEIAERVRVNMKTAHEHVRRLTIAGLIVKRNRGRQVEHSNTERGVVVLNFLRSLE